MSYSPSRRIKAEEEEELSLNLNSMMDMFAVLIPALLMMSASVQIAVVTVKAPGSSSASTPPQADTKPPLNLTVAILEGGYLVTGVAPGILPEAGASGPGLVPNIPVIEGPVSCSFYRGTVPPPRSKNQDRPICGKAASREADNQTFIVYDRERLVAKLLELKNAFPDERMIIIQPGPGTEYEAITELMDASRQTVDKGGTITMLFDEAIISPALL